jgi:hypothetical protein
MQRTGEVGVAVIAVADDDPGITGQDAAGIDGGADRSPVCMCVR